MQYKVTKQELGAEVGSGAGAEELQLGGKPESKIWERSRFFGSQSLLFSINMVKK